MSRGGDLVDELGGAVEPKRECRAGRDGATRMLQDIRWDHIAANDRIAPLVELDGFRKELGAEAAAVAGDRIDPEHVASHYETPFTGSSGLPPPLQPRPRRCRANSMSNTWSALRTKRTAPSG